LIQMRHILVKNFSFYQAFTEIQNQNSHLYTVIKILIPLTIIFCFRSPVEAQSEDSLSIQYSIVGMMFYGDHDVLKIKVPPWMKSSELVFQIKKAVIPDERFPPTKKTYIYVFKETDQVGATSKTGAVYDPGKGFRWDLKDWRPTQFPDIKPTEKDFEIYDDFIDTIIQEGLTLTNIESRQKIAAKYQITIAHLDSICAYVKYWLNRQQDIKQ